MFFKSDKIFKKHNDINELIIDNLK